MTICRNNYIIKIMDKLDDFLRYSTLFLYYGELFSKKQKQYLELYLEEDRSLSEISEEYGITRQAVFDNIKRGFRQLDEYERKLKIFEKEKELKKKLENLKENFTKENLEKIIEDFECFVAIDDYGSGYATESWLLQVSPDFVKIDMSLIRDIDKDNERKKLVGNIIQYNKDNNIKTIAEGVETYDEMSTLIELGIDYLQGYYLGKPDFDILDISEDKKREIQILYSLNTI